MFRTRFQKALTFLILAAMLFAAFAGLSEEVISDRGLDRTDASIAESVYKIRSPELNNVMTAVTSLASTQWVLVFCLLVITVLLTIRKRADVLPLLSALAGASLFAFFFKELFARSRPPLTHALVSETGYSFPSGHTLVGICLYGVLVYFVAMAVRRWWLKLIVVAAGTLLVLGIGFSRIYLGVHWPSDVVASLLLGSSWLFLLAALFQYYPEIRGWQHRNYRLNKFKRR